MPIAYSNRVIIVSGENKIHSNCISHLNDYSNHFNNLEIELFDIVDPAKELDSIDLNLFEKESTYIFLGVNDDFLFKLISNQVENKQIKLKYFSKTVPQQIIEIFPDTDFLAFQRHMVSKKTIEKIEQNDSESMSIGLIRNNNELLEPNLRDAQYVHINFDACRKADCPLSLFSLPTGLNAEEICQITRDSADAFKIKMLSYDTSGILETTPQSAEPQLIAESIWYFLEGLNNRAMINPALNPSEWSEFIVNIEDSEVPVIFKFSSTTGKWWSYINNSEKMVPCSAQDYKEALKGRIADRLYKKLFY